MHQQKILQHKPLTFYTRHDEEDKHEQHCYRPCPVDRPHRVVLAAREELPQHGVALLWPARLREGIIVSVARVGIVAAGGRAVILVL